MTCGSASRAAGPAPGRCSGRGTPGSSPCPGAGRCRPTTFAEAYKKQVWTAHHWQHWLARGKFPDHPWRGYLQRSALTLKGLTYSPTGAITAAGSTSLPETPGGERNYDYRFTWIRDATFALWGLYSLGFDWEAVDFFSFIADIASRDEHLQIMYGIGGEKELEEYELDHLPGYANSRPVRIGNAAYSQNQHDVWGALLDSVYLHFKAADHVDGRIWPILDKQVNEALKYWREPDAGIWEVRGELQHFTSSKIMCWVAVDRGAKIARISGEEGKANEWELAAQEIKDDILANGVDERGVLTQYYGTKALDASLLLAPLVRFLPADDPIIRNTVLAIADELTVDGLVLRYKVEETDDGFAGEEGSFTICSFWLVSALCEIGEYHRARKLCAKLLSFAGPLDLYGEEIDPHTGQHLGNFPQAFTHLALINAVLHVIKLEGAAGATRREPGPARPGTANLGRDAGHDCCSVGARRRRRRRAARRRRPTAGGASSGNRPPRWSSRPATPRAPLVLVGEQPGDVEDRQGVPFVGPAGKLLQRALAEAGDRRRRRLRHQRRQALPVHRAREAADPRDAAGEPHQGLPAVARGRADRGRPGADRLPGLDRGEGPARVGVPGHPVARPGAGARDARSAYAGSSLLCTRPRSCAADEAERDAAFAGLVADLRVAGQAVGSCRPAERFGAPRRL